MVIVIIFLSTIFQNIILPILFLIVIGAFMQRKFKFNLRALSNLITYCLMPAAVFINLYETDIKAKILLEIIGYLLVFSVMLMIVSALISKVFGFNKKDAATFKNSIVLMNSGNYGIPVSQLIFHAHPLGISIQIIDMIFQNIITYTYGLYNLIATAKSGLDILRELLKLPIIHALLLGGLLNSLQIPVPDFILIPIDHLANAFPAIALLLLGAQLAQMELKSIFNRFVFIGSFGRLLIGPALALALIFIMKIDGVAAQSLFIASAFPKSRNSSTLALEYDVNPNLAAQIVLFPPSQAV